MNDRRWRTAIMLAIMAGMAVRFIAAIAWPGVVHPDETLQYQEQAYRVVTGRGLVPWEFVVGARSWLLPGLLVPVVAAVRLVSTDPVALRLAVGAGGVLLAGATIAAMACLGGRVAGRAGAMTAALLGAAWPDLIYFGSHVLADTLSAMLLAAALATGYRRRPGSGRAAAVGLLLGCALVVRPQLAPAVLIAALAIGAQADGACRAALIAGGAAAAASYGVIDWLTWGTPFASLLRYVVVNANGVADSFGRSPPGFYATGAALTWGWAALPVAATALIGARRAPILGLTVLATVATFSAIGHKEHRFILPALPLLLTLCAIGTAALIGAARRRGWRHPCTAATLTWIVATTIAATTPMTRATWSTGSATLAALDAINRDPAICGVGLRPATRWADTGLSRLRDDVALHDADGDPRAYNTILLLDVAPEPSRTRYGRPRCRGGDTATCVLRRAGGCAPGEPIDTAPDPRVAAVLRRAGL